ncbi:hypothetical protein OESDEN_25338 [Oesophagostomum dentatum]|uniref:Uncharacterized protein n=1 Tax=Oesophagostomum dentatum TaxID=61180 RepID=A0A0B1RVE7_OESDE|nr:hypothetical protein OESDEN_25338 [Oesophagostomum dentatum]
MTYMKFLLCFESRTSSYVTAQLVFRFGRHHAISQTSSVASLTYQTNMCLNLVQDAV